jgi:hypothetical protein
LPEAAVCNAREDRADLSPVAANPVFSVRLGLWALLVASGFAHAQGAGAGAGGPPACPVQPVYPLPASAPELRSLADQLESFASIPGCLKDAHFHAWRGAVLVTLGRAAEAAEPLERALLIDPDLPGATLDLAQALGMQGDQASASALLAQLRARGDLPEAIRLAIDRRTEVLAQEKSRGLLPLAGWQSRWQVAAMLGVDTNLNNAPSTSEVTLTLPSGNQTFALDPAAAPRKGLAVLSSAQWTGLKAQGESVWVLQGELRSRATRQDETSYEQADLSASWLQAPAAPRQWVVRTSASYLRFGGTVLLEAYRASLQHQWEPYSLPWISRVLRTAGSCRPSVAGELEYRRYPTATVLDGAYRGIAGGLICRADADAAPPGTVSQPASIFNLQVRLGEDKPFDDARAGGDYKRGELRAQWEGPVFTKGKLGVQWSSTIQKDTDPYSPLLGNVPRKIYRNGLQLEASWPVGYGFSLISTAETGRQRSNLAVFESAQRSFYLGIRRDVM